MDSPVWLITDFASKPLSSMQLDYQPLLLSIPGTPSPVHTSMLAPAALPVMIPIPTASLSPPNAPPIEVVWHHTFDLLFMNFPDRWSLGPTLDAPLGRWREFRDAAKVRFLCTDCGNGWTSMKGRVLFWFTTVVSGDTQEGFVLFKLFGQQCRNCKEEGGIKHAMWYPEEVVKVIINIYHKICQVVYRMPMMEICKRRRMGRPQKQHNADFCEACQLGICSAARARLPASDTTSPSAFDSADDPDTDGSL